MDRTGIFGQAMRHFLSPVARLLFEDDAIPEEERVSEVLINGPQNVYCERKGRLHKVNCQFADDAALLAAVRNIAEFVERDLGEDHHSMDARLPEPECFRVHVIIPPCSRQGIFVTIRKSRRSSTTPTQ